MKIPTTRARTSAQAKRGSLQRYPDRDENGRGGGVVKRSSSSDPDGRGSLVHDGGDAACNDGAQSRTAAPRR
jgi:hypothetical protein